MNDTTVTQLRPFKVLLSVLPCLFCLYLNTVMLFTVMSRPFFRESARYVLFAHLLVIDSLQLVASIIMYIFAVVMATMITYICAIVSVFAVIAVKISPLNLALMSLERYVAVCFPLRHAYIATTKRTGIAIAVLWTVVSFDSLTQFLLFVSLNKEQLALITVCHMNNILERQAYSTLNVSFISIYFIVVGLTIIFTYISVMITVKSTSSNVQPATKAHKTLLLHLFQLFICLFSLLFHMLAPTPNVPTFIQVQYVLFLTLIIFPKCLSPLLYGLRDDAFRRVFKCHFVFGLKSTVKPFT